MKTIPEIVMQTFDLNSSVYSGNNRNPYGNPDRTLWWRLQRNNDQFILKAKKHISLKQTLEQHKFQKELSKSLGIVESPQLTTQGTTAIEHEQRVWSLSPFLGEPRKKLDYQYLESVGATLAKFHNAAENITSNNSSRGQLTNFLNKVETFLATCTCCAPYLIRQKFICNIAKECVVQTDFNRRYERLRKTTIHGDFCERNVLWTGDNITGLIDLELLGKEIPSFDLCFFASEYLKDYLEFNWCAVLKALLSGYCHIHDIDRDEKDLIPVTFLLVTIYRFLDDNENIRPVVMLEKTICQTLTQVCI